MMQLLPYKEYKKTDVPWLGDVPSQWEVKPLRTILKQRNEKNSPIKTEQILSLSIAHGVTLYSHEGRGGNKSKSDLTAYKIAHVGDIVLNSMNVIVGAVGLSRYTGAISPVYYALYPRTTDIDIHYYDKIFSNAAFQRYLMIYGKGILIKKSDSGKLNTIRMKISPDDLKGTALPLPSQSEQAQIARFLDWKTAQINKFIRNKRRLIELLKEQKQNIINQAVTRGLDPNVKLKPSGVEWIGDVPEHWEVRRLKFLIKGMLQYGANEPSGRQDSGCPRYVRISDIKKNGELRKDTVCTIPKDIAEQYLLYEGDILFARSGATVGKTFCYQKSWGEAAYAGYLIRAKVDMQKVSHEFLFLFTRSLAYSNWIESSFIKATIQNISADKYASLWIPLPPRVEQESILGFIQQESEVINQTISRAEREIELMHEYRTRLISDVVTGKIDVRSIEVPEVAEEELLALDEGVHEIDKSIDDELEMEVEG